ncbi:organic cation transporter protein isoform X2 [Eurytemora carolleeae]|uniref:organic cation transporter protein isoform X2 n=1 Tax=Eurytemora carolleeae TaxID=1294199 RepID=UPI000C78EC67|nr:organic cation transporter protein isoform X2 [Eurytemora carolleeae]|eukprot:XP_023325049.1 organic cation transporter protein-like isoform X2 [Eurytemora affinis]
MEEGIKEEFNYDEVLAYIGQFGKFQKKIFIWLWLVSGVTGLSVVTFGFTAYTPNYRVATECDLMNSSYNFDTDSVPFWFRNKNDNISLDLRNQDCRIPSVEKNDEGECVNVYFSNESIEINSSDINQLIFDRTIMRSTLVEEYQFVCDRSYIRPYISALFMLGMLFGSFLFGFLSDTFGRIKTLMLAILWLSMAGFLGSFCMGTSGVIGFGVLRVLTGMGCTGSYIAAFVLGIEHVGYKFTMLMGIAFVIPFAVGEAVFGIEAYLIREWQILQIVAYLPIALLLAVYWCVPESVRWLVAHNKFDQAKSIIRRVAKENGRECPEHLLKHLTPMDDKPISTKTTRKTTILDLFSTRLILTRSLNMFFQWFSVTMCYYGLTSASTTSFAGDVYGNFLLSVLIEIPSYLFCIFLMDIWGRRPILSFCQIISGVSCIIIAFLEGSNLQGVEVLITVGFS